MAPPARQITLGSIFLAMTWVGACCGAWVYLVKSRAAVQSGLPSVLSTLDFPLAFLAIGGPFVAYEALRGRYRLGFFFALFFVGCLLCSWLQQ